MKVNNNISSNNIAWFQIEEDFKQLSFLSIEDVNDGKLAKFFVKLRSYFEQKNYEQWQVDEAKKQMDIINGNIQRLKHDMKQQSVALLEQRDHFNNYINTMYITGRS